jgi:hypothetical protein
MDHYNLWAANFGSMTPGSGGGAAVPEPASIVLLPLAAIAIGLFGRRRAESAA